MNEKALKKKAHDYVVSHYAALGEAAYIAGYKAAMQRISDTISFMRDDIIEYNRQVDAITVLNDISDYLEISDEEFKECVEELKDCIEYDDVNE